MNRRFLVVLAMVLSIGVLAYAAKPKEKEKPKDVNTEEVVSGKLAPAVAEQIVPPKFMVFILGKTQMLETPGGYDAFCKENANAKRTELRPKVIAKLKSIAEAEQTKILAALGNPKDAKRLWLVNGFSALLTGDEIRKAALMDEVKFIYPEYNPKELAAAYARAGRPAPTPRPKISTILKPATREPFTAEGKKVNWNLEKIGAKQTWEELKVTGEGVVVADFDSGVDYTHPDLQGNIWVNIKETPNDGKDDDGNGVADDLYGYDFFLGSPEVKPFDAPNEAMPQTFHGLCTAGIIRGDGTKGTVTGVAPRAKLMLLTVGAGIADNCSSLQYALENGADVLNGSFSIPNLGQVRGVWRMMYENANCAGLVLVSGAGNFGKGSQAPEALPVQIRIPGGIPCVITAGGIDEKGAVSKFLSLGPVDWSDVKFYEDFPWEAGNKEKPGLTKPDVLAFPGPFYPMLHPNHDKTPYVDPNKSIMGNSFSSPHITGIAALILSAAPDTLPWRVKEIILTTTAQDLGDAGKDNTYGAGLANAFEAVKKAIAEKK